MPFDACRKHRMDPSASNNDLVDQVDYELCESRFDTAFGHGDGGSAAVPEPATLVLLFLTAPDAYLRRGRAKRELSSTH